MKQWIKWSVPVVALALTVGSASATSITGEVDMSGTVTLNNTLLGSASAAGSFSSVVVGGTPTGSFVGTTGDGVTWTGFSWPSTIPVSPLWTYHDAGTGFTYSFALNDVHAVSQDNTFLNLSGDGTLTITGVGSPYTPTSGNWTFTVSNPGGGAHANFQFTFANSQTAVPDGGTTVMLLGVALTGLGLLKRKLLA